MNTVKFDRGAMKRLRRARAISLEELAERANLTRQGLHYIERGMVEPKVTTLAKIASTLGVRIEAFFRQEGAA